MTQCSAVDCARPVPPHSVRDLGEHSPYLFVPMHMTTAIKSIEGASLPTTRELLAQPKPKILGDPRLIALRLTTNLPAPFTGKLGDYGPLSPTPRTVAMYGSYGPRPAAGAETFEAREIVIAVIALSSIIASGRPIVFFDRLPVRSDAEAFAESRLDLVPYDLIRNSSFATGGTQLDRNRYNCELLVDGGVPIALGVEFAVVDKETADALAQAVRGVAAITPLVRPGWFFKR